MGGNAFNASQPNASFPRMPPSVYEHAKAKIRDALTPLYDHVATPHEAPQKLDHGDIDFIVCAPTVDITHDELKEALGATWSIPKKGTSNFALPWDAIVGDHIDALRRPQEYIQADIYICDNVAEFERMYFCHSYGDLAMILGLMARGRELSFGTTGIRLAHPLPTSPPITFHISSSFPQILDFFGLSMGRWKEGFTTQQEIFDWISSSPFYNPGVMSRIETDTQGGRRARQVRGMYRNFLEYASQRLRAEGEDVMRRVSADRETAIQSALQHFGRWDLYSRILYTANVKNHVNACFTGKLVTQWTGVLGPPVRWIMDEVKNRLGGDELDEPQVFQVNEPFESIDPNHWILFVWQVKMSLMSEATVRSLTAQVKEEMETDGRLAFDWKIAKQREIERKKAKSAQTERASIMLLDVDTKNQIASIGH